MKEEQRVDVIKTVGKKDGVLKAKVQDKLAPLTEEEQEAVFEEKVVQIDRVTRVVKGGRRLRFRALVVVGNKNGQVGLGVSKASEVSVAVKKAVKKAKKNLVVINIKGLTIPHESLGSFAGAKVFLKPASEGTGIIAGGAVRAVIEVLGVKDILSKMLGSKNKVNNVYATLEALKQLRKF